tara:strand:- start:149 stop:295 length:147 start_codon:yes stop_codon:yes gene_type:complete
MNPLIDIGMFAVAIAAVFLLIPLLSQIGRDLDALEDLIIQSRKEKKDE